MNPLNQWSVREVIFQSSDFEWCMASPLNIFLGLGLGHDDLHTSTVAIPLLLSHWSVPPPSPSVLTISISLPLFLRAAVPSHNDVARKLLAFYWFCWLNSLNKHLLKQVANCSRLNPCFVVHSRVEFPMMRNRLQAPMRQYEQLNKELQPSQLPNLHHNSPTT